jgi:hypothetical protein
VKTPAQQISAWEYDVLASTKSANSSDEANISALFDVKNGWLTATQITQFSGLSGPSIRPALNSLVEAGLLQSRTFDAIRLFKITGKGLDRIDQGPPAENSDLSVSSRAWTGIVDPIQAGKALAIVAEMEDVCEQITNNHDRAQIYGLIRALELLLTLPDPPRQGVVSLARDPAFANIVQVATFLAALIAAVKA